MLSIHVELNALLLCYEVGPMAGTVYYFSRR